MRYLLDTCTLIWFFEGSTRIGVALRDELTDSAHELFASDVSLLEITLKYQLGKFPLPAAPSRLIPALAHRHGIELIALDRTHIAKLEALPLLHRDPFDRLLLATALVESMTLVTPDPLVAQYDAPVFWRP
jgi:PIN domain nuclease of toxin-antitoxin system